MLEDLRENGRAGGHGLLVLLPSEQAGMVEALKAAHVPVKSTRLNPASLQSAASAMQALLSKHPELKVGSCCDRGLPQDFMGACCGQHSLMLLWLLRSCPFVLPHHRRLWVQGAACVAVQRVATACCQLSGRKVYDLLLSA